MPKLELNTRTTALILIDLQQSNVARQLAPHAASTVVENGKLLANAFRACEATVILVRVLVNELLPIHADIPIGRPAGAPPLPEVASMLVSEIGPLEGDIVIEKRQWGAFYGTNLEQQLRRHGITTIVIGGIATNIGVESTARAALDHGYNVCFVEDAMSSINEELHRFAAKNLFPIMGKVVGTADVLSALKAKEALINS